MITARVAGTSRWYRIITRNAMTLAKSAWYGIVQAIAHRRSGSGSSTGWKSRASVWGSRRWRPADVRSRIATHAHTEWRNAPSVIASGSCLRV